MHANWRTRSRSPGRRIVHRLDLVVEREPEEHRADGLAVLLGRARPRR